ncbi:hypothetical protein L3X38_022858 [Prunus dulcis]|uniref:Uncharacterized protein n=1 Tax=Prunus dulcis TaxID=3755 RepID=A0AAD4VWR7_PRUDU|nr:hypothetical protein L3X38_022858 [Prunus dulcis]
MSNLIRSCKAVTSAQSSLYPAQSSSATTTPALIDHLPVAKKNTRGPCLQLKTAKVTRVTNSRINIRYDERHRAAPTTELHSSLAHDIDDVVRTHSRCNGSLGRSCLTRSDGGSRPVVDELQLRGPRLRAVGVR